MGNDLPPVQRITRRAASGPASVVAVKPAPSRTSAVTRAGWTSSTPAARASRTSASSTVRAESVTGKSFPVSSSLSATPASAKNRTVSATPNRRSTLRMPPGVLPAKSCSVTTRWVTLHRPPPATRILAPSFRAPSTARIVSGAADGAGRAAAVRPAQVAANSPAAPAPTTRMSTGGIVTTAGARAAG